jgi:uncharacterized protein YndB with AHSA1/START domain
MADYATAIDIHATPDEVFEYLVTANGLTAWMGQHAVVEPVAGGAFQVDISGAAIRGEFLEVVRPHRVVVSWGLAGSDEFPPGRSRVTFTLTETADGTRVDLLHSDLPELRVAGHVDGWAHFLPRLASISQGDAFVEDAWIPMPWRGTA